MTSRAQSLPRRAVFVDRDGTLNVERDYLVKVEDFEFVPGVPQAIRRLRRAGFLVIVVTNQSGVARGYFSLAEVESLHAHIQRELNKVGTAIDAFYICPHHPVEGVGAFRCQCDCRKGAPGLLLQAAAEHHIDLTASFMVGDKRSDLEAGERAGCTSFLVRTGYGQLEAEVSGDRVSCFADLPAAVQAILETSPPVVPGEGNGPHIDRS